MRVAGPGCLVEGLRRAPRREVATVAVHERRRRGCRGSHRRRCGRRRRSHPGSDRGRRSRRRDHRRRRSRWRDHPRRLNRPRRCRRGRPWRSGRRRRRGHNGGRGGDRRSGRSRWRRVRRLRTGRLGGCNRRVDRRCLGGRRAQGWRGGRLGHVRLRRAGQSEGETDGDKQGPRATRCKGWHRWSFRCAELAGVGDASPVLKGSQLGLSGT